MKHQFLIEIADSPAWPARDDRAAFRQLQRLGVENRLGECIVQVQRVTERPAPTDARSALRPKKG